MSPSLNKTQPVLRHLAMAILSAGLFLVLALVARAATTPPPRIDLIEKFLTTQIQLHFDVPANKTYRVEYTGNLGTNGHPSGPWSNLYTAPNLPFEQHYVVVDYRTDKQRFYRLHVLP
jgi:hypothetical protein